MNRERCKELLPVITAFANGEDIQHETGNDSWLDIGPEGICADALEDLAYRIKPKPREFWLCWDLDRIENDEPMVFGHECPPVSCSWKHTIKVREVLDEDV